MGTWPIICGPRCWLSAEYVFERGCSFLHVQNRVAHCTQIRAHWHIYVRDRHEPRYRARPSIPLALRVLTSFSLTFLSR